MIINNTIHSLEDLIGIKDCDGLSGPDQIVQRAGMDYDVYKDSLEAHDPKLKGYYALKRNDTDDVFSIVKGNYEVIQTRDILEPFDQIINDAGGKYINAGVLNNGGKVWVQAELPEELKFDIEGFEGDKMMNYAMLIVDHTGMGSNALFPYTNRVSCNNQFYSFSGAAHRSGLTIRHSSNWKERLENVRAAFFKAMEGNQAFMQRAEKLLNWEISEKQVRGFANVIFPDVKKKNDKRTHATSEEKKREEIVTLFSKGLGNRGQTRWDAFNAVTEYLDHHQGSKRINKSLEAEKPKDNRKTFERRFISNMTGGINNNLKHRAFKVLLNDKVFQNLDKPEFALN